MDTPDLLAAAALGAAAAAVGTPAGVSGGLLLLPALLTGYGLGGTVASATNLLFNIVSTPAGIARHLRARSLDGHLAAPATLLLTGRDVHRVAGAALVTTLAVSVAGLATYAGLDLLGLTRVRTPHWPLGLALGAGGLVGAYGAALFAARLPDRLLRGGLAVLVAGAATRLALV